eukprot:403358818
MRIGGVAGGSQGQKLNMTNYNDQNYHSNQDGKQASNITQIKKKNFKQPVISYRNQSEIMKKIFGNEQYYNQVKSLFKGPQDEKIATLPLNMQQTSLNQRTSELPNHSQFSEQQMHRAQSTPHQEKKLELQKSDQKRKTMNQQFSSPNNQNNMYTNIQNIAGGTNYSQIHKDQIVIAKSREKLEQIDYNRMSTQPMPAIFNNSNTPQIIKNSGNQGSDQVEKAIFDLQDVKNNYFQEKQLYDQKIQKIQIKQQNSTIYGGSFLQGTNQTAKTQTGFFNNQRPMTQGNLFKNQSIINDENILQGDLEKVSKEDLRERLVVAEMVMKKLFQRNKDLEDIASQNQNQNLGDDTPKKSYQIDSIEKKVNKQESDNKIQSLQNDDEDIICKNCIDLRKESTQKESELQFKINELQLQLLEKTDTSKDQNHLQYLRMRLEETMNEAKRHFNNYIQLRLVNFIMQLNIQFRNTQNQFLESRLNSNQIQGGMKGQKLQGDILSMLKKNLEQQDQLMQQEQLNYRKSLQKIEQIIDKKDLQISKKDKKIKKLHEEIERRQFLETKVQKYVKGLITKNQKCTEFLQDLSESYQSHNRLKDKQAIDGFLKKLENKEYDENEGESTENENEEEENQISSNSVEVDDL